MSAQVEHVKLYKNHGGVIGYWEAKAYTDGEMVITHAKKLDGSPVTTKSYAKPKNVGKANETSPAEQAIKEITSKASKKLDKGYVKDLEAAKVPATNSLGLARPMLATPIEKVKPDNICFEHAYVQPKLDGHRCLYKEGQLYSRQGKPLNVPHIQQAIEESSLRDLHLDGELYVHGKPLQDISRLIKKYRPGESEVIQYHIYDQIHDASFLERISMMNEHMALGDSPLPHVLRPVLTLPVVDMVDVMEHHARFRSNDYEGTMLRYGTEGYQDDKRSRTLLKIKEFHDAEFLVTGCLPGKEVTLNNNTFTPAVWICHTPEGKEFNVLASGTAQEKHQQFINRHQYIGKPLTVKYHYLSKDSVPQLPTALRFRDDI